MGSEVGMMRHRWVTLREAPKDREEKLLECCVHKTLSMTQRISTFPGKGSALACHSGQALNRGEIICRALSDTGHDLAIAGLVAACSIPFLCSGTIYRVCKKSLTPAERRA